MRLVTWNCCQGLSKKRAALERLPWDVLVVQECSETSIRELGGRWIGSNRTKGLGVVVRPPWRLAADTPKVIAEWIFKVAVTGPMAFDLYAVWACKVTKSESRESYIGQVHKLVELLRKGKERGPAVVAGDWNSSAVWNDVIAPPNHSTAVAALESLDLVSAYHRHFGERQGAETRPTLYLQRNRKKPYHVDYVFIPRSWLPMLKSVSVGNYEEWRLYSDHAPIACTFALS